MGRKKPKDLYMETLFQLVWGYTLYVSKMDEITLTKQIVKHGNQSIIILPKILGNLLKPKTLVEVKIKILTIPEIKNAR
jgi:hypothetical protein